jgi:A/G-specific adenine glycosylase
VRSFAARLIAWQKRHGRHDLPWQRTRDAYAIWLSEIMLQQTQVAAVIPYYKRFLQRFPTVQALARAPRDDVLALWSGLGYYSRARNLHDAARIIMDMHRGRLPDDPDLVQALPGIGRSTAAAICVFAYGGRHAILDGNVKRVLARHAGIAGYPGDGRVQEQLWAHAEALLPARDIVAYTQGLMDLGAGVCGRRVPACEACPLRADCVARRNNLTHELPGRKPRRALPQRETVMLILRRANKVLLEQRPPRGIWGGLWSLPEISDARDARRACRRYGGTALDVTPLAPVAHGFTHFGLTIRPLLVRINAANRKTGSAKAKSDAAESAVAELPTRWCTPSQALAAGLSAPVRKIILSICF